MGVKHFYLWYRRHFEECMRSTPPKDIDNFAIDLNGLFHLCAQKVFRYGNVNTPRLLGKHNKPTITQLCKEVCHKIDVCRRYVNPRKRFILCVDGIAGLGKMNQQRQRRFRAAKANHEMDFDPNGFTPGTELMDYLTRYIDGYIKTMISTSPEWQEFEVVFSNEKVAGEGEHKIMQYIKKLDKPYESYCIYGLDADLIMLGMLLPVNHVCIFREMEYDVFHVLDIELFQKALLKLLRWEKEEKSTSTNEKGEMIVTTHKNAMFSSKRAIFDFVLLCFLVGNDFLPTIPSMAILDGTIDIILKIYKDIGSKFGHMTKVHPTTKKITFRMGALKHLLLELSKMEKTLLEKKYNEGQSFFPDPLVMKNLKIDTSTGKMDLDFESYKRDYYRSKFNLDISQIKSLVHLYLDGMTWVINYYVNEIPDWLWFFKHLYAPFLSDMVQHMDDYQEVEFPRSQPVDPFLQLLVVMPPACKNLLPCTFHHLFAENSELAEYYPNDFEIDVSGKRKDWEGIVVLPPISLDAFQKAYQNLKPKIGERDAKRNIQGKSFLYMYDNENRYHQAIKTSYGMIPEYKVKTSIIRI